MLDELPGELLSLIAESLLSEAAPISEWRYFHDGGKWPSSAAIQSFCLTCRKMHKAAIDILTRIDEICYVDLSPGNAKESLIKITAAAASREQPWQELRLYAGGPGITMGSEAAREWRVAARTGEAPAVDAETAIMWVPSTDDLGDTLDGRDWRDSIDTTENQVARGVYRLVHDLPHLQKIWVSIDAASPFAFPTVFALMEQQGRQEPKIQEIGIQVTIRRFHEEMDDGYRLFISYFLKRRPSLRHVSVVIKHEANDEALVIQDADILHSEKLEHLSMVNCQLADAAIASAPLSVLRLTTAEADWWSLIHSVKRTLKVLEIRWNPLSAWPVIEWTDFKLSSLSLNYRFCEPQDDGWIRTVANFLITLGSNTPELKIAVPDDSFYLDVFLDELYEGLRFCRALLALCISCVLDNDTEGELVLVPECSFFEISVSYAKLLRLARDQAFELQFEVSADDG